jgi:hypothetical protein
MRNKLLTAAVAGLLLLGGGYGTAWASDHNSGAVSVSGEGKFALGTFDFDGYNDSDDPFDSSGYFKADGASPADAFLQLRGRVTCLEVDGNRAGFLYPIEDDSMPGVLKGQVIKISIEDGGDGSGDHIGFVGPAPEAAFPDCAPGLTPFEVTEGDVEVNDKS